MAMSPAVRRKVSSLGGLARAADPNSAVAARAAFEQKFVDQVDPDRLLPPAERQRRADLARRAHFTRLSLRAQLARQRKQKAATTKATAPAGMGTPTDPSVTPSDVLTPELSRVS